MHGNISAAAIVASAVPVATERAAVASDTDPVEPDKDWFYRIAIALLGDSDTGFALHVVSRSPEGSCYKYVTRNPLMRRQPPAGLIRTLLRSDQGWQWLSGLMEGSDAEWWRDVRHARAIKDAIDAVPTR